MSISRREFLQVLGAVAHAAVAAVMIGMVMVHVYAAIFAAVLSTGRSSRLYRAVREQRLASSAMAYKRNPMRSERINSLARFVLGLMPSSLPSCARDPGNFRSISTLRLPRFTVAKRPVMSPLTGP